MMVKPEQKVKPRTDRITMIIEIAVIVVGLAFYERFPMGGFFDGTVRFNAITELLHGHISNMSYSMIGPLFFIPFYFLGKIYQTPLWWAGQYNKIVFVVGLAIIYWLLKDHLSHGLLRKFFIVLLVASMFGHNVAYFGGEPFTAMCVCAGIAAIVTGRSVGGWIAVVVGVANTPATIIGLIVVVLVYIITTRRLRYILAIAAAAALIMAEAWIRRGSPFNEGYSHQTFSTPFFFGVLAILFSFGKGLIFYTPGLLLPMRKKLLAFAEETKMDVWTMYALWVSFVIGLILIYAPWWAWDGGWFWGPRFFLVASVPASFAIAVYLQRPAASLLLNLFVFVVLCLSVWIGIDGVLFREDTLTSFCTANHYAKNALCQYDPYYSFVWHPFAAHLPVTSHDLLFIAYSVLAALVVAFPLLRAIGGQAAEKIRPYLTFTGWRV